LCEYIQLLLVPDGRVDLDVREGARAISGNSRNTARMVSALMREWVLPPKK